MDNGIDSKVQVRPQHGRTPEKEKPKVFEGTTSALPEPALRWIEKTWGIKEPPYWYWTDDYGGRIAMSVRSPRFLHRGWCLRDVRGTARNKTLNYIDEGEEGLSWYIKDQSLPTIIVEDIPSAVRAATYCNSVALLGTAIGTGRAVEIAEGGTRPLILALDNDAILTAVKYQQKYRWLWDNPELMFLHKDLKNMEEKDLQQLIQGE
jgi:hypothetical protein